MRGALIRTTVAAFVALNSLIFIYPPAAKAEPLWTKIYETTTPYRTGTGAGAYMTYVSGLIREWLRQYFPGEIESDDEY